LLVLLPAYGQSIAQNPQAEKLASQLWDKLLRKCGTSYYLYLPAQNGSNGRVEMWQYNDVRFELVSRAPAKRASGTQWEGVAVMNASAFRSRTAKGQPDSYDLKTWDGWKPWSDAFVPSHAFLMEMVPNTGDPPNVIWMRKAGGKWSFWTAGSRATGYSDNMSALDEIARRKPSCTELRDQPPRK
jgi:hypothetical protein